MRTLRIFVTAKPRLQPGIDSAEQPKPYLVVIARERDHKTPDLDGFCCHGSFVPDRRSVSN